ncbi:MAG: helix-turn-helix transcriptional regulator [Pseudomonadota bacterium]
MLNTSMTATTTKQTMGLVIVSLRESLGISRYALARDADVDYAWLRRFEMGQSGIRVETLLLLAKGLKVPAATIVEAMERALESE